MRRIHGLFAAVLVAGLLLVAGSANAAAGGGASEILAAGGFNHTNGADDGSLNVDLSYGYYLSPGWQLGFRQAINYTFVDDRRDFWLRAHLSDPEQ